MCNEWLFRYPVGMALVLVLQKGVLLFRTREGHQATKVRMKTRRYPILFWEATCIESLENHLLVGFSLVMCRLGRRKWSGFEANLQFSSAWAPDTPFSAENEGGHEHWPRKFASVGVAALVQHFISFTQPPAELGRYCKKKRKTNLPSSICSYTEVKSLYASLLLKAHSERTVVLLAWPSVWGWDLRALPSLATGFLLCLKLDK